MAIGVEAWAGPTEGTEKVSRGQELRERFQARGYRVADFSQRSGISHRTLYRMFDDDPTVGKATWSKAMAAIAAIEEEHGLNGRREPIDATEREGEVLPQDGGPYRIKIEDPAAGGLVITFDGGDPVEIKRLAIEAYRDLMGTAAAADSETGDVPTEPAELANLSESDLDESGDS